MGSEVHQQEVDQNVGESFCKESPKVIQAIKKNAVHQICSGQVVLNLAIAVKELVENSLDAGATSIEVRLKEYGSKLIEVVDNGCGVEEQNFQGLTLKHHTSKLRDFSDLVSVETFGFRGEALSSLCALSEMTVITRHVDAACGTKLEYDHRGQIVSRKPFSRQVGTSVAVCNLFASLPVRQKEFHRNLRREFTKMTHLLFAYCLVSVNVKITCSNQVAKGGRATVVSTLGGATVRENIACVFGAKQAQTLVSVSSGADRDRFLAEGHVSSCAHGLGRGASDRQFYYVNSRPCEPTKIMKLVNEIYRTYNVHQYPFVFLNVTTPRADVDVNVTPDKRQVFLEHEKELLSTVRELLQKAYESVPSTFRFQNMETAIAPHSNDLPPDQSSPKSGDSCLSSPATSSHASPLSALLSSWRRSPANDIGAKRAHEDAKLANGGSKKLGLFNYFKRLKTDSPNTSVSEETEGNSLTTNNSCELDYDKKRFQTDCLQEEQDDCLIVEEKGTSVISNGPCELSNQESTSLNIERVCELGSQQKGYTNTMVDGEKEGIITNWNGCSQTVPHAADRSIDCIESVDEDESLLKRGVCEGVNEDSKKCTCPLQRCDFRQLICPSQGMCDIVNKDLEQSMCPSQGACDIVNKDTKQDSCDSVKPDKKQCLTQGSCDSMKQDTEQSMSQDGCDSVKPVKKQCITQGGCDSTMQDTEQSMSQVGCCDSVKHDQEQSMPRNGCDSVNKDFEQSTCLSQDGCDVTEDESDIGLVEDPLANLGVDAECGQAAHTNGSPLPQCDVETNEMDIEVDPERPQDFRRRTVWSSVTLDEIRNKVSAQPTRNSGANTVVRFRAGVDPAKNQSAEQELGREIAKHMFSEMHIIGQFNLGFIITRLDQDLFIIDQHASDEKYNFETLQQRAALSNQRLVRPLPLEVSAVGEGVLIDNAHIFRTNGFEFDIDETADVTKRVMLTAIPISKNWEFGKEDIDELIFMLQDAPGTMCRPSRVRAMFASRACRKSVMIGTALGRSEMRRLVNNMGTIEQPWNCPHGRPTMRHLINLDLLQS